MAKSQYTEEQAIEKIKDLLTNYLLHLEDSAAHTVTLQSRTKADPEELSKKTNDGHHHTKMDSTQQKKWTDKIANTKFIHVQNILESIKQTSSASKALEELSVTLASDEARSLLSLNRSDNILSNLFKAIFNLLPSRFKNPLNESFFETSGQKMLSKLSKTLAAIKPSTSDEASSFSYQKPVKMTATDKERIGYFKEAFRTGIDKEKTIPNTDPTPRYKHGKPGKPSSAS